MTRRRVYGRAWTTCAFLSAFCVAGVTAQSTTSASLTGTIRSGEGLPIARALVTLSSGGQGNQYEATASSSGGFNIRLIRPGSYELRVEALGFRPLLAQAVVFAGGDDRSVDLTLMAATPPVVSVDTITLPGSVASRVRSGALQLGAGDIESMPYRFGDLAAVVALSTGFDEAMGAQGLPGDMTRVLADGLPFYRAPHPTARVELLPDGLFVNGLISTVGSVHGASDVEQAGSAAGYVSVATQSTTPGGAFGAHGAWSGEPLWSSTRLDVDAPSLLSFQGGASGTMRIGPTSSLVLAGEALQHESPLSARISDPVLASDLAALDSDLLDDLTAPATETYARYSGLARYDLQRNRTQRFFIRGIGAASTRSFDGAGPLSLWGMAAPAEDAVDFSAALGFINASSANTTFELRSGVSGSFREFGEAVEGRSPAFLTESGAHLGAAHSAYGKSSRTDVLVTPILRYALNPTSALKFGAAARVSRHSMTHSPSGLGDFVYSAPAQLLGAQGFGELTDAPEASFGTQEYGFFAQYEGSVTPSLRMTLGGRYDLERIGDGGAFNGAWFDATGLSTSDVDTGHHQFGARVALAWDVSGSDRTRVLVAASIQDGDVDPRAIAQVFAEATDGRSTRYSGGMLAWPGGTIPAAVPALPSFTMLGPDTRPPRTTNLSGTLTQKVGVSSTLFVTGASRRTDFLLRRRNLNLPLVAPASDPDGRDIFGTLEQTSGSVVATGSDARRFAGFGPVWALDPDGWSEYLGVTAGIEHSGPSLDLYASYTWSETTDNWVGARAGTIGAAVRPGVPVADGEAAWSEGVSDFDVPHRLVGAATVRTGPIALSAIYRFESGDPFTPGYRVGVDANGDGSIRNDVAFVPSGSGIDALTGDWACLSDQVGGFAVRNSCRRPNRQSLSAKVEVRVAQFSGRDMRLTVEGFNLIETIRGLTDTALLLVDPGAAITTSPDGRTVTIPVSVNPDFGSELYPTSRGRMLRVGFRVGG